MRNHLFLCLIVLLALSGCVRPDPDGQPSLLGTPMSATTPNAISAENPTPLSAQLGTPLPSYAGVPTPDPPHHDAGQAGSSANVHIVNAGETLGLIAQQYQISLEELLALNPLINPDIISIGQEIIIPGDAQPVQVGPSLKLIPDSELVYGPAAADFDTAEFVQALGGFLASYSEEVEGQQLSGSAVVQLIADRYSINPRLLLAVLEHQSGWVTLPNPANTNYPLGYEDPNTAGLYLQLYWAANLLNLGYYGRAEGGQTAMQLADGSWVNFAPEINDGTAGVQNMLGAPSGTTRESWQRAVSAEGFLATYTSLFGNPFAYTVDPIVPANLAQPTLVLPWTSGETWYLTSGPHGGWNSGSAWAALDFAPPADQFGCVVSDNWVTAMAPGTVVRSEFGAVVVDGNGDGSAATGWGYVYMHLETRDRVPVGTQVATGDRLGHPSCEGGFSNGTHLHVARTYNGRWISADGALPFVLSGWVTQGLGREYDGLLVRGEEVREACVCREDINAITAD